MTVANPSRRRGAPPGNSNALKHGFYSRYYKPLEARRLARYQFSGLQDEIEVLRVLLHRTVELYHATGEMAEALECLRHICLILTCLNRLARTQALLLPPEDSRWAALEEAAGEITSEWPVVARRISSPG
jgi:hypothetical protein